MFDFDLAKLYETETKTLNQAIKRNSKRFPPDFMFRLTIKEWQVIRSQSVTASESTISLQSQSISPFQNKRNTSITPYAFTKQGVAMLSVILNSDIAINMNIAIMRAFVEIRKILLKNEYLKEHLKEIREWLGEHDVQLNSIYDALENLLDEKVVQRKWESRDKIGFNR